MKMMYRCDLLHKEAKSELGVLKFQKSYNLKDAIYNISLAWSNIKDSTICRSWCNLWPLVMLNDLDQKEFDRFKPSKSGTLRGAYDKIL